ncbi:MAG: protein kinase domain-containing protein, partial [bacterium]
MSAPPSRLTSALSPRYDVDRELGRGGMATVYLARDTRHDRHVAVKVLDPELAASVGADRFLAEIRLTAQLHHPNILQLFDSGEADGLLYYVMPYISGETLRARLTRERQLPVADAVRIATSIANALEYAHKAGVIHRDLKPENILLNDGEPLVADFGIALALRRAAGERLTLTGLSLGTPQYMSPEQATGDRVIDARADIFSLGCVLYETLAGETPFSAATAQATIARILTETPRTIGSIRPSVPEHVDAAIQRALEKLPADRWTTAKEFADAMNASASTTTRSRATAIAGRRRWIPWTVAGAAVVVAAAAVVTRPSAPADTGTTLRFPIVTGDSDRALAAFTPGVPFSISRDNRRILYVGTTAQARSRLYVRSLDELRPRPVPGTEGFVLQPAFSPDGRWIAFVLEGRLLKMPADGGAPALIASTARGGVAGLDWFTPDTLLGSIEGRLTLLPAAGGTPVVLSRPDTAANEIAQWGPHVVDADWIVYVAVAREGIAAHRVALFNRKSKRTVITPHLGTTALGVVDDHVVWVTASGAVMAARLTAS